MGETYTGEVRNGMVVFDDGTPPLPEGMRVRLLPIDVETSLEDHSLATREQAGSVERVPEDDSTLTLADRLRPIIGAAKGLPSDLAEQHDHYLHGTPKR